MADYRGAWLIGSIEDMDTQTVTIGGMPLDLSGDLYLYDTTLARSLISRFAGLMSTAGIAAPLAFIRRSGYVYLESSGVFTVNWGASTILRDLLGFDANLSGASSYVAPYKSPLLFAPGKPETPVGHRLGTAGHKVHTQYQAVSAFTGRAVSVSHGSRTFARYSFPLVSTALIVSAANEGGTFARWWQEIAVTSSRWKLYRDVLGGATNTTAVHGDLVNPLGPYVHSNTGGNAPRWNFTPSKGLERTDLCADIDISAHIVPEFT